MPSFEDFITYGRSAWAVEKEEENKAKAEVMVKRLLEQMLDAKEPKNFSELGPVQPEFTPQLTPSQKVDLNLGLNKLQINPHNFFNQEKVQADANIAQNQASALDQALPKITDPAQLVDISLGKSVAPYSVSGGVGFNKYTGKNSFESSANQALANYRDAKAGEVDQRVNAIDSLFQQISDPATRAAIINKNSPLNRTLKQFKKRDGSVVNAYTSFDENGKQIIVRVDSDAQGNDYFAVPKANNQRFRQVKDPATVWQESLKLARNELSKTYRYSKDGIPDEKVKSLASNIFNSMMEPPEGFSTQYSSAVFSDDKPDVATPQNIVGPEQDRQAAAGIDTGNNNVSGSAHYRAAANAINDGAPRDLVIKRLQAMKLDPALLDDYL